MTRILLAVLAALTASGCLYQNVRVDPVKVEPIHMTVDVNLHDVHDPMPAGPKH